MIRRNNQKTIKKLIVQIIDFDAHLMANLIQSHKLLAC